MNLNKMLRVCALILALGVLAACATAPATRPTGEAVDGAATAPAVAVSQDPGAPLERRATDRWKLLIARDGASAYKYLTPGFRATKTEKEYVDWVRARQVAWSKSLYQDHTCSDPDSCKVGFQLTVKVTLRGVSGEQETTTYISEQWLKIDGVWYHLPKEAL